MAKKFFLRSLKYLTGQFSTKTGSTNPNNWSTSILDVLDPVSPATITEKIGDGQTPISEWTIPNHEVYDQTTLVSRDGQNFYYVGLQAYHPTGILSVDFNINNGGWIAALTDEKTLNNIPKNDYFILIPESSIRTGLNEVRARIYPTFGTPIILQGRDFVNYDNAFGITYSQFAGYTDNLSYTSLFFWKYGASAENLYVNLDTGNDSTGTGTSVLPYKSIEGAIYKKWESINFADGTTLQVFPNGAYINVSGGTSGVGYVGVIGYTGANVYPIIGFSGSVSSTVTNYIHPPIVINGEASNKPWFYGVTGSSVSIGNSVDKNKITRPVLSSWRNFVFGPNGNINAYSNLNGATAAFFDNIHSTWNPKIRSVRNFLNCDFVNGGIKSGSDYLFKAFIAGSTFDVFTSGGHPTIIAGGTVSTEYYNKGDIVFDIGTTFANSQTTLKLPNTFQLAFIPSNASKLYKRDSIRNCNAYGPRVNIDSYLFNNYDFNIGFSDSVMKHGIMIESSFVNFHKGTALGITGQGLTAARTLGITSASGTNLGQNNYPAKWNYGIEPYILKSVGNPTRATKYNIHPTIISNVSVANTKNTGNLNFFAYIDDQIGSNYSTTTKTLTAYSKDGKTGASQISNYAFNDVNFISATSGKFTVNGISFINESSSPTKLRIGGSGVIYNNFYFNSVNGYIDTPLLPVSTTVNNKNGMWMNSWYMNNCLEPVAGNGIDVNGNSVLKPGNPNVTPFSSENNCGYPSNKQFIIDGKLTSSIEYSPYLYNAANQFLNSSDLDKYDTLKGATAFGNERSNMNWEVLINYDINNLLGRGLNAQLFKNGKPDRHIVFGDLYFNQLGYSGAYVGFVLEPKFTISDSYVQAGICGQNIPNLKKMEELPTYSSHGSIAYQWLRDGLPIIKEVTSLVDNSLIYITSPGASFENEGPSEEFEFELEGDASGIHGSLYGNTGGTYSYEQGLTYQISSADVNSVITCKVTYTHYDNREGIGEIAVAINDDNFLRYSLAGNDERYWITGYPKVGYLDGPDNESSKIVGFGTGIDTSDIDISSIIKSQSIQNSVYSSIYGIVARKSSNYEFKVANAIEDHTHPSHNIFNDKFIFALRNEDTGEKIWWHNGSDAAITNVNANWETFKHSYFLGETGITSGYIVSGEVTNYTNSSGSEVLAKVLNDFNTSGDSISDAKQDGIVNAADIASTLIRQFGDSDKLIGIKAYGYDNIWNSETNIDHTTDEHPIYDLLNRAAASDQKVTFEMSDDLNKISFLITNETGSPSGYEPMNYPILPSPSGVNYWVNPETGSNSNSGITSSAPVKTIGKALQLLHANAQWSSTKPGYVICQDAVYDYDTLGQTYAIGPSALGNVLIPFGATASAFNAHRGNLSKKVYLVSDNFLGAKIRGSRALGNITGISAGIVNQGISAGSRTFAIPYNPSNIYLAGVTGVQAVDIRLFTSEFPQPYRIEDQDKYVPSYSHYQNMIANGISFDEYELNVSQFSVYYSKALAAGFTYGPYSINGITSPTNMFFTKPGYESPVTGATIGYFDCIGSCANASHLTYSFLLDNMPAGNTISNYWNNTTLGFYTSDNNIAYATIHSIVPSTRRIYVNKAPSSIETIRRLSIFGHPNHLGFTGAFAISGATMYVKPFDGLSAGVLNSRIQLLDTVFGLEHTLNYSIIGFDISEIGNAVKTSYRGAAGLGPSTQGIVFKYNKVQDTSGGVSVDSVTNDTLVESNLFNRSYYRPFNNTSKFCTLKNNTFLHHRSHSGIFCTEGSLNTVIDGNLLYTTGALHGNGIAVYSNAANVIVRNNGIYGDVIVLAINHYGKTADEFICEDNVLFGSGGIDLRQNLNRLNFEHNTCIGIGQASRKMHDNAGYNWWGLFDQKFRYNVYQSMSGGLVTSGGWNTSGSGTNPDWTGDFLPPCTIETRGYTAALYYDFNNNPQVFAPALPYTGAGNVGGFTYNPNFTDYYMVGTQNQSGSYGYAHNCYVKPFDNPEGLPNNYRNMVIGSGTFPVETQPDSGTDIFKCPREITRNIFYCLNRLSGGSVPVDVDNITPAYDYIFEDHVNFNYKIKETAYAIPPTALYFTQQYYSATSGYDTLYAGSRSQRINDYIDGNGDGPGVRWTTHPPASIYDWWLWQENVGFYAPPAES